MTESQAPCVTTGCVVAGGCGSRGRGCWYLRPENEGQGRPPLPAPAAAVPEAQDGREAIAALLAETDALTPTDAETLRPEAYIVEAANLPYLVGLVLGFASAAVREDERERLAAIEALCRRAALYGFWQFVKAVEDLAAPSLAAPEGTGEKP